MRVAKRSGNMIFSQLFAKLKKTTDKKGAKKEIANPLITSSSGKKTNKTSPHNKGNINQKRQLNTALNSINYAIQSNGANSQLLLDKAEILIQKEKYKQASRLLNQITRRSNGSKISKKANQLLSLVQ